MSVHSLSEGGDSTGRPAGRETKDWFFEGFYLWINHSRSPRQRNLSTGEIKFGFILTSS